jgi:hypothetical protein
MFVYNIWATFKHSQKSIYFFAGTWPKIKQKYHITKISTTKKTVKKYDKKLPRYWNLLKRLGFAMERCSKTGGCFNVPECASAVPCIHR